MTRDELAKIVEEMSKEDQIWLLNQIIWRFWPEFKGMSVAFWDPSKFWDDWDDEEVDRYYHELHDKLVKREIQQLTKKLNEYIKEKVADELQLDKVILFGSYAKGTQREFSDLDLALFSEKYGQGCNHIDESVKVMELFEDFEIQGVEPHLYTLSEIDKASQCSMLGEILKTGIVVYERKR
ncbi:MAG: Nucleotidyltransferase domain protein [Pelotomaculum sp. PtaU1.Bin065]|nr:MAG: Nucleotidyltransferase domain protein [Pelotomaculum sp. PtaU1.Bin065]